MNKKTVMTELIMEQARTWYVRMGSELAGADDWALFTDWLEESPLHVDAYDQVELSLSAITAPALDQEPALVQDNAVQENTVQERADNVVPLFTKPNNIPENKSPDQSVADKKRPKIVWARYAGIAALFVAALTVFYSSNFSSQPSVQTYATNIGGQEAIVLADGTRINLNTNTQISVAMTKKSRIVTLASGEAFFDIAKDKKRPFIVNARDVRITDIGTSFSVYSTDTALTVSVVDGIVDMQNGDQTTRVIKGQQAVHNRGDNNIALRAIDVESISTWRDGVLIFEDAELATIIPELNRYFETQISFSDEDVADLTFSGVLNISDQSMMLGSMEALMPIKSERENGQILLSSKN